jgi:hypothetical protein
MLTWLTTWSTLVVIVIVALWIRFVLFSLLGWRRNSPYRGLSATEGESEGEIAQVLRAGWQSGLIEGWDIITNWDEVLVIQDIRFNPEATEREIVEFLVALTKAGADVR